jgi:hypothetical protein
MPPAMTLSLNPQPMGVGPAVPAMGLGAVPPSAWTQQLQSQWCWLAVAAMIDCVVPRQAPSPARPAQPVSDRQFEQGRRGP